MMMDVILVLQVMYNVCGFGGFLIFGGGQFVFGFLFCLDVFGVLIYDG